MAETMKAVRFHRYGGAEVLAVEAVAKPAPGPRQVLVRIRAASVNPIDWKLRDGVMQAFLPVRFPAIAGQDLAGVVEAVGAEVADMRPGDAVFAMTGVDGLGAYAEYIALDRDAVAIKPASLDFKQAASIPMGALTAWQGIVEQGGLQSGQRLFVHAAGGNVGGMAVQIGRALGAHVTAAAAAAALPVLQANGAERTVDYAAGPFEGSVRDQDVVFDTLAGDMQARSWGLLKPGGILVSTLGIGDPARAEALGVRAAAVNCVPNGAQLARVAQMVEAGQIRPNVGAVFSLDEAAKAQELNRSGAVKGKIVLSVD